MIRSPKYGSNALVALPKPMLSSILGVLSRARLSPSTVRLQENHNYETSSRLPGCVNLDSPQVCKPHSPDRTNKANAYARAIFQVTSYSIHTERKETGTTISKPIASKSPNSTRSLQQKLIHAIGYTLQPHLTNKSCAYVTHAWLEMREWIATPE